MADLDAEFAKFQAELATVEQEFATEAAAPAEPAAVLPPPRLPPPVAAPPVAAAAAAPPRLAPPALVPPPLVPPPVAAAAAADHGYDHPHQHHPHQHPQQSAADAAHSHRMRLLQQQQLFQQQQQYHHQQHQHQQHPHDHYMYSSAPHAPPAAAAAAAAGHATHGGLHTGAPADEATLRKLKEDLLQQHQDKGKGKKPLVRTAAGERWVDAALSEWPDNDHRIFVGDIGNEVTDELLSKTFSKYPSFAKARVVRDKRTNKSKGYGFVSLLDANDFAKALREMQGKYIGNRPCKLRKSSWEDRNLGQAKGGGGGSAGQKRKQPPAGAPGAGPSRPMGPKRKNHISIAPKLLQQFQ